VENSTTANRLKQIEKRMERLEKKMDKLLTTFEKHIKFIDNTYAGLQKPIASIKKFLKG
jgi:glycogen debranching enzyme|tara:strand:+ start:330 stop:506 length:177 start_codon:yes stop_codon:yes gene_type:complete